MKLATVKGRFLAVLADTTNDVDSIPDQIPLRGTVILTPSVSAILDTSGEVPATLLPTPVTATLDEQGDLSLNGVKGVQVAATMGEGVNPSGWTYRVAFNLQAGNVKINYASYDIQLPPDEVTDLTLVAKVPTSTGIGVTRGVGIQSVTAADGTLTFRLTDATTHEVAIDGAIVTSVAGLAGAVSKPQLRDVGGSFDPHAILAKDYGVAPTATAEANTTALRTAITDAQAQGRNLILPTTAPSEFIDIAGELRIEGAGKIEITTSGVCAIRQTVKPETILRLRAPSVTVRNIHGVGAGLDMTNMGTAINYARYCAVWMDTGCDGSRVYNVKGTGLHRVVRVDPDETTTATPAQVPNIQNLKALDIESDGCWVAVSAVGFNDLEVTMRGTYKKAFANGGVDTTGQPPHLLYVINRETTGRGNYNLHVGPSLAWDSGVPEGASGGEAGAAYAIKGVTGLSYDGLQARNCAGLLDLINIAAVEPGTAVSIDDVYPLDGNRASVAIKDSRNAHIRATVVAKAGGDYGRQLYVESTCTDALVEVDLTARPTAAVSGTNTGIARVSGQRNEVRAKIANLGAHMRAAISVSSASNAYNRIINPVTTGSFRYPVEVLQGLKTLVQYDPAQVPANPEAGAGATSVYVASAAYRTILRNVTKGDPAETGYTDSFNRLDGTPLTMTDDGQAYTILNGAVFRTAGNMLECAVAAVGGAYALPAGGTSDGVITIKIGTPGTGTDGYMLRTDYTPANGVTYPQDFLRLQYRESSTVTTPRLQVRSDGGSVTTLASAPTGTAIVAGDTITVTLAGQNVTVALNGTTIITATDTVHNKRVASGPMVNTPASGHWKLDEISFVPAPAPVIPEGSLLLISSNGTRYRLAVADSGALTTTSL